MAISRSDRAKQFQPFDALKGLKEALKEKEKEIEKESRKNLSEEMQEDISEKLKMLKINDKVKIQYYDMGKYKTIVNCVSRIDMVKKLIRLVNGVEINFIDIYDLEIF